MTITTPLTQSPGDWGVTWDGIPNPPSQILNCADQDLIVAAAIAHIWRSTGRQFGLHRTVLRPCLRCGCPNPGLCGCFWYDQIDLDSSGGERPVTAVTFVKVDGVALDPATDYGVINNRWLVRTPQGDRWPPCQDEAAIPAPLEIDWTWGISPDSDLVLNAVYPLIAQLALAEGGQDCQLDPTIVKSVQREGVSFAFLSDGGAWKEGATGIARIDAAIIRAWPFGAKVQMAPGFFDPADDRPEFVKFERAGT